MTTDFSTYTKPSAIGAGVWYLMHLKGENLESEQDIHSLYNDIQLLRKKFECKSCRGHFNDFAIDNDPENELKKDLKDFKKGIKPENLAKWLVSAHNGATKHKFDTMGKKIGQRFDPTVVLYKNVKNFFHKDDEVEEDEFCVDCDKDQEETSFSTVTPYLTQKGGSVRLSPRKKSSSNNNSSSSSNNNSSSSSNNNSSSSATKRYSIQIIPSKK